MKRKGTAPLPTIRQGQTYPGVHEKILSYLKKDRRDLCTSRFFDVPCGRGEFLEALRTEFPSAELLGGDIDIEQSTVQEKVCQLNATEPFPFPSEERFDVITSISGVMTFDNTEGFIRNCVARLNDGGLLIVSNDNTFTVRDRLNYLLVGRFRKFPLFLGPKAGVFKRVPIEELCKLFHENGMEVEDVRYLVLYREDWPFIPLAVLLYPVQWLYCLVKGRTVSTKLRNKMFPFASLLCRHFYVVCRKSRGVELDEKGLTTTASNGHL